MGRQMIQFTDFGNESHGQPHRIETDDVNDVIAYLNYLINETTRFWGTNPKDVSDSLFFLEEEDLSMANTCLSALDAEILY